jgi:hypothetical protein
MAYHLLFSNSRIMRFANAEHDRLVNFAATWSRLNAENLELYALERLFDAVIEMLDGVIQTLSGVYSYTNTESGAKVMDWCAR